MGTLRARAQTRGAVTIDYRIGRWGALALAGGAVLFGLASLFHPPTVNPWDPTVSLVEATKVEWIVDHWALLIAVVLVYFGLFAFHSLIGREEKARWSPSAYAFAVTSLALWVAIFLFEATGWPVVAKAFAGHEMAEAGAGTGDIGKATGTEDLLMIAARALWAPTLSVGYAAAFFLGVAIFLWALDLVRVKQSPLWLARLGAITGAVVAVVEPVALGAPRLALWWLIPAAALLGLWMLAAAWWMWRA